MKEKTISVKELYSLDGESLEKLGTVTIDGWVRNNRNSGKVGFIALHDGTCFKNVQIVYDADKPFLKRLRISRWDQRLKSLARLS